ncbi:YiiX family permuted papain-like enzyme [soil metagenome]
MERNLRAFLAILLTLIGQHATGASAAKYQPQEGDVLFQSMPHNPLTDTIEAATSSPFSHCGLAHRTVDGWIVIEAIGPVKETPINEWTARGRGGAYTVFRVKEKYREKIPAFVKAAQGYEGLPYDIHYEFDDRAIYCSELIFKAFRTATGEELGKVQALGNLKLDGHEDFIRSIEDGSIPRERKMITPQSLSEASQLEKIHESK